MGIQDFASDTTNVSVLTDQLIKNGFATCSENGMQMTSANFNAVIKMLVGVMSGGGTGTDIHVKSVILDTSTNEPTIVMSDGTEHPIPCGICKGEDGGKGDTGEKGEKGEKGDGLSINDLIAGDNITIEEVEENGVAKIKISATCCDDDGSGSGGNSENCLKIMFKADAWIANKDTIFFENYEECARAQADARIADTSITFINITSYDQNTLDYIDEIQAKIDLGEFDHVESSEFSLRRITARYTTNWGLNSDFIRIFVVNTCKTT